MNKQRERVEVISDEDGEQYLCTGTNSRNVAYRAIKKFAVEECGMDEEYLPKSEDELDLVPVWEGSKEEPDFTYWGDDKPDITSKYVGSGWRWKI
jgi:hypothetical protein